jgi:hypothetical protein
MPHATSIAVSARLVPPTAVTASRRLWGLDWSEHLPKQFEGITVSAGQFADALPFIRDHYAAIFGHADSADRFLSDPMTDAKRRFGEEMDVFVLRDELRVVGLLLAHPSDWTTYYMRSVALLPEYRDRRLLRHVVECTYEPLRAAGVERIEGDCSPAKAAMMRALTKLGFTVTATRATERWGLRVCHTKILRDEAETVFVRQFCDMQTKSSHAR